MSLNHNDCAEPPAHLAARLVKSPEPGDGNETQNHMDRLRANVAGPHDTMPTGYIDHCDSFKEVQDGSGSERYYTEHWDKGFAGDNDPYGIGREYVSQSANPNAALYDPNSPPVANLPTQDQADAVVAQAQAELDERAAAE